MRAEKELLADSPPIIKPVVPYASNEGEERRDAPCGAMTGSLIINALLEYSSAKAEDTITIDAATATMKTACFNRD